MAKLKIKSINVQEFTSLVKKLLVIDKFIFLKINEENITSSVFFEKKDAVKYVRLNLEELFQIDEKIPGTIKISFFNGHKIIAALSHFTRGEVSGEIIYAKHGDEYIASDFVVFNDKLQIKLFCSDPSLAFMEMTEPQLKTAFNTTAAASQFELLIAQADEINSLFNLDKETETFKIGLTSDGIKIIGENYDNIITNKSEIKGSLENVTVYKKYFDLLDKENYTVSVCENKIVFESQDTETKMTIAVCVTDEE